jgi:hypothetical protein
MPGLRLRRCDGHHELVDFRLKGRHDFSPAALADQCRASTPMEIRPMTDEAENVATWNDVLRQHDEEQAEIDPDHEPVEF